MTGDALTHYDAFISYSHAAQSLLAAEVQRGLQRFAAPLLRPGLSVFRDQTSLAASAALWPAIERALAASRYFVLLASPESAASTWVQRELTWWLENRDAENVLIVVTDGTLQWNADDGAFEMAASTALPAMLRSAFPEVPLYVDLTWAREKSDLDLRNTRFRQAIGMLSAGIRDKTLDELDREDVVALKRRRNIWMSLGAGMFLALVAAGWGWRDAIEQRNAAQASARRALAGQLAAESRTDIENHFDRALLRAAAATRLAESPEIHGALQEALAAHPQIVAFLSAPDELIAPPEQNTIEAVAISRDGGRAITLNALNQVRLWDIARPRPLHLLIDGRTDQSEAKVQRVAISGDGTLAATATDDGVVRLWDTGKGHELQQSGLELQHSTDALALDANGSRLAAARGDGSLQIWGRTGSWKPVARTATMLNGPVAIAFSADGLRIASLLGDGTMFVWDATNGALLDRRPRLRGGIAATGGAIAFGADDGLPHAVVCSPEGIAIHRAGAAQPIRQFRGYGSKARVCSISGDGERIISGGDADTVILWSPRQRQAHSQLPGRETKPVAGLRFSADGQSLLVLNGDGEQRLWNLQTRSVQAISGEVPPGVAEQDGGLAAVSVDRRFVVRIGNDDVATLLDRSGKSADVTLPSPGNDGVIFAAFSADGSLLGLGDRRGEILIWDMLAQVPRLGPLAGHDGAVFRQGYGDTGAEQTSIEYLVFSADRRWLLSITGDGTTRLWDLASPKPVGAELFVNRRVASAAAFDGGGHRLAIVLAGQAQIWDTETRRPIGAPIGSDIMALAYDGGGERLATAHADGTLSLWEVGIKSARRRACAIAARNLTREEWARSSTLPYVAACPQLAVGN